MTWHNNIEKLLQKDEVIFWDDILTVGNIVLAQAP